MDEKVKQALIFIREQFERFPLDKIVTINSFGKDSMVMQHLVMQIEPTVKTLWIQEPFSPKETNEYAHSMIKEWNINIEILTSEIAQNETIMKKWIKEPKLWKTNPEVCCDIFKCRPLFSRIRELGIEAWFSGLRNTESSNRRDYPQIWEHGILMKLHPILNFTEADVWRYLACRQISVNPLYLQGYRSLGCEYCSQPNVWDEERSGRWMNTEMRGGDCGIHLKEVKKC